MSDDLDALLGDTPAPTGPKRGRPSNADRAARQAAEQPFTQRELAEATRGMTKIPLSDFKMPVGLNFLASVFNMDAATVRKRLLLAPTVGLGGGNRPIYDFKTAVEYLVKPKMDLTTYLATLNPAEMPNSINKAYWESRAIRLKFELAAGQAWATEDVLSVFGTVFMAIKERTKLWVEDLRESGALDDEQLMKMGQRVDAFQAALHADLIDIPAKRKTRSLAFRDVEDFGPMVGETDDVLG